MSEHRRETYSTTQPLRSSPPTILPTPLRDHSSNLTRLLSKPLIAMIDIDNAAMTVQQALPSPANTCNPNTRNRLALRPIQSETQPQSMIAPSALSQVRDMIFISCRASRNAVIGCQDLPHPAWWKVETDNRQFLSRSRSCHVLSVVRGYCNILQRTADKMKADTCAKAIWG